MTTETTIVEAPLSLAETEDLTRHRETIRRGQQTFVEVGLALADIRDRRLYRETHASLENWLADEYPDIGRRRAYQLISGAETAQSLAAVNHGSHPLPAPTSERSVRPLAGLAPDEARAAYTAAVETAGGKAPTGEQVAQAASAFRPREPEPELDPPDEPLTPLEAAVAASYTPPAPPTPIAPVVTGEVIAAVPATPPPAPPPITMTPLTPAPPPLPGMDAVALKQAEAAVALLEMVLAIAQVERDRLQVEHPDQHYQLPDAAVESAARMFVVSPALRAATGFLAMSAQEA